MLFQIFRDLSNLIYQNLISAVTLSKVWKLSSDKNLLNGSAINESYLIMFLAK